jgi:hypothetical protein
VHEEERFQISVGSLTATGSGARNRTHGVLEALQLDHLNPEERRVMEETCKGYQDIFYLQGDRLSCMTTVKHSINVVPGTSPVYTRPYRLPESQKAEIENQVNNC